MAPTAEEEVAALDRVLTRLALTEDANLEKVLDRLVPAVLEQLRTPHAAVRAKVLEMLSHVNKRLAGQRGVRLPLPALLALFLSPQAAPMTRNFALVYVESAFSRAQPAERFAALPQLTTGIAARPQQHQQILLRLATCALEHAASPGAALGSEAEMAARYACLADPADTACLAAFWLKVLLLQQPSKGRPAAAATPLAAGLSRMAAHPPQSAASQAMHGLLLAALTASQLPAAAAAAAGAEGQQQQGGAEPQAPAEGPVAPGGLSLADVALVTGKEAPSAEALAARKLGILNFCAAAGLSAEALLPLLLAAACDPADAVARRGEELLRKRCGLDSPKPAVDLESQPLIKRLFALCEGSPAGQQQQPQQQQRQQQQQEQRIEPASPALRARIVALFCRSVAAANQYPDAFKVAFKCVYGAGSSARLKQTGMQFTVWLFRHAAAERFQAAGPRILDALLALLDDEGGAAGSDAAAVTLRGFTYQAIGQLGERVPAVLRSNLEVPRRFFAALAVESPGVRATLQEALSSLAPAYRDAPAAELSELRQLLVSAVSSSSSGVRYCAAVWAVRLLPFADPTARFVSAVAAGDSKLEVREAGAAGLEPAAFLRAQKAGGGTSSSSGSSSAAALRFPPLLAMLGLLQQQLPRLRRTPAAGDRLLLQPGAFLALVRFLGACRQQEAGAVPAAAEQQYQELLEHALVRDSTAELQVSALAALLQTAAADPTGFAGRYGGRLPWLQGFLGHSDERARWLAAKLLGLAAAGLPAAEAAALLGQLRGSFRPRAADGRALKWEERCGAMLAAGVLLATGGPELPQQEAAATQAALAALLSDGDLPLAAAAAQGLGVSGLTRALSLPEGQAPAAAAAAAAKAEPPAAAAEPAAVAAAAAAAAAAAGQAAAAAAAAVAAAAAGEAKPEPPQTRLAAVAALGRLAGGRDPKAGAKAAAALGWLAAGEASPAVLGAVAAALLGLRGQRHEGLQLAVGEALCFTFGGVAVGADEILRTHFRGLAASAAPADAPDAPGDGPAAMAIDGGAADAKAAAAAHADPAPLGRAAVQEAILSGILDECIFHTRGEVRAAACVWLASLVSFTGRQAALLARLSEIQEAFGQLLGDAQEGVQDVAARGISAVYRLGGPAERQALLTALISALQGGAKKRRAVKLSGDTRVFEEGQLGSAPGGGSLTTYQELCSLATEMGQPDLLYKFMDLANHASALNTSAGAAFGFASIARIAGEQLQPYVAQLIPKLYRLTHDPQPRVREAMAAIWRLLVPDARAAVDAHFDAILQELLREMGGRLWRNREAAALATADVLQGRRWAYVSARLAELWTVAFRVFDDIKESVRQAAATLMRTLRGLTLRLADPAHTPAADAAAAVDTVLPLLLSTGLGSSVAEVQALSLQTIARLVQLARPQQLSAHLPELVGAMLESLSGLEDARVNYVEQHASRLGLDAERLEDARVAASRASPMADTLEHCARIATGEALAALVPRLGQLVRRGTGLNTRVGTARFIASLTLHRQAEMRAHAGPLTKALVAAAAAERSSGVRKAYAAAAGSLAAHASGEVVARLAGNARSLFFEPGDAASRQLGGLLARELFRKAGEAMQPHEAEVLPVAFLGACDGDSETAALWAEAWAEGAASEAGALFLHAQAIVAVLLPELGSQQWERKRAAAQAIVRLAEARTDALPAHAPALAGALLQELPGRVWDGKERLLQALGALCAACPAAFSGPGSQPDAAQLVQALLGACQRGRADFRAAAVAALTAALSSLPGDFCGEAAPLLRGQIAAALAPQQPKAEAEAGEGEAQPKPLPLPACLAALAAAWQACAAATAASQGQAHAACLASALNPGLPWAVRAAALAAATQFVSRLAALRSGESEQTQGSLQGQEVAWAELLVPGVLGALEEPRISNVRAAALDCLAALLQATQGGQLLGQSSLEAVRAGVEASAGSERNAGLQAQARSLQGQLPPAPMATD